MVAQGRSTQFTLMTKLEADQMRTALGATMDNGVFARTVMTKSGEQNISHIWKNTRGISEALLLPRR